MYLIVRNETDSERIDWSEALLGQFPSAKTWDPSTGRPSLDGIEGVVLSGSSASVDETEAYPWIEAVLDIVPTLVERSIPTLGVGFGHQAIHAALGGTVEPSRPIHRLVEASLSDDPLFDGVEPVFPTVDTDTVTDLGDGMKPIATTAYRPAFGTRHETAPVWTLESHPELSPHHLRALRAEAGWTATSRGFEEVSTERLFENFRRLSRSA
ncbi:MAG: type 1 glutamine amidotransferase [Natronomonas sp.]